MALGRALGCQVEALALEGTGGGLATGGMETTDSTLGLLEDWAEV